MRVDDIEGVITKENRLFKDNRGSFIETFKVTAFPKFVSVQDNHSFSKKGVLRGLHYVKGMGQNQILSIVRGEILDFLVDLRRGSPTYLDHKAVRMSYEGVNQIFIPSFCAHGFLSLTDNVVLHYKADKLFSPQTDATINIFDSDLGIEIPKIVPQFIQSEKDARAKNLCDHDLTEFMVL